MADEAAEFWSAFEKETGEKVLARSMGEWFRPRGSEARGSGDYGLWGLLILTDKSFRYKYIPSENWIMSIFKRVDKSAAKEKPVDIVVPREDIERVVAPKRGFMQRIFGPVFPRFTVFARGAAEETGYSFSVDPSAGILAALEKICAEAAEAGSHKA